MLTPLSELNDSTSHTLIVLSELNPITFLFETTKSIIVAYCAILYFP